MGFFDFLRSNKKEYTDWTIKEKALLLTILSDIGHADGVFDEKEKQLLARKLFSVDEGGKNILEIQNVAGEMWDKDINIHQKNISASYKKLDSKKKSYIIDSVSEMMNIDGIVDKSEMITAHNIFGSQGGKFNPNNFEVPSKTNDDLENLELIKKFNQYKKLKLAGKKTYRSKTEILGLSSDKNIKGKGLDNLMTVSLDWFILISLCSKEMKENNEKVELIIGKKLYDWKAIKKVYKLLPIDTEEDKIAAIWALEAIGFLSFEFGNLKQEVLSSLIAYLFNVSSESTLDFSFTTRMIDEIIAS